MAVRVWPVVQATYADVLPCMKEITARKVGDNNAFIFNTKIIKTIIVLIIIDIIIISVIIGIKSIVIAISINIMIIFDFIINMILSIPVYPCFNKGEFSSNGVQIGIQLDLSTLLTLPRP